MKQYFTKELWAKVIAAVIVVAAGILMWLFCSRLGAFYDGVRAVLHILNPFTIGFSFAYLIAPLVNGLEKLAKKLFARKRPRNTLCRVLAIVLAYLFVIALLTGFVYIIVPQIVASVNLLSATLPDYLRQMVSRITAFLTEHEIPPEYYMDVFGSWQSVVSRAIEYVTSQIPNILSLSASITSGLSNFFIGCVVSICILFDKERFCAQIKKLCCAAFRQERVDTLVHWTRESNRAFGGYISGKIIDSLIVGVLCYLGMLVFRMEYAILISVVIGVTNLIPFFGPFIGGVPCTLILLIVNPISALWFALFILVLQQIDGNIIGPRVLGESIGLSSFWIIMSLIVGGGLFGVMGMMISIPIFAVLYAIAQTLVERKLKSRGLPVETKAYYPPGTSPRAPKKRPASLLNKLGRWGKKG